MTRIVGIPFSLFYWFHRFNFLGIRIGFSVARASGRLFYQLRNTAVLIDSLLSCFLYLSILSSFWCLLSSQRHHLPTMFTLLASDVLLLWLLRQERKERLRNTFTPFSIYNINIGSAKILRGNVSIVHLFVDGRRRKWTKKKIARVVKKVEQALSWISKQAEQFKVDVAFENKGLSETRILFRKAIPNYANLYRHRDEFHELIRSSLGNAMLSQFSNASGKDQNICLFVHVLKRIRSFAVPDILGEKPEKERLEYSVIECGARPSTYAHELLHLFGADDYYSEYSKGMQMLKSHFLARSIMFSTSTLPLEDSVVDDLTAQNIGWL